MSASKSERVLNLLIALLSTQRYLTKHELRDMVEGYRDVASFDRTFERDKDELRALGIPIERGSNDPLAEDTDGYRVRRADFELPEIEFTGDELVAIGLAAHAWQSSIGAESTASALQRLRAVGAEPDPARLPNVLAHIPVTEGAFDAIYQALFDRREIQFSYAGAPRRLQPWRLAQRRGQWLVLGFDLDRGAPRRFKLHHITGGVRAVGPTHAFEVPDEAATTWEPPVGARATVAIAQAPELLLGAREVEWEGLPDGFRPYEVERFTEAMIVDDVLAAGADAFVLAPTAVRAAVIARLKGAADE